MRKTANNRRTNQGFLRVPYVWLRGGSSLSLSALITKAAVFSFTKPDEAAEFTYKDLKERYALSHATVARCVTSLCTRGEIRRGDRKRDYRCDGTSSDEVFIKVEEWLFHARFGAEEEYLTRSEIMILSLVRSHPDNFTASVRGIARILDLSPTTVCAAREKLLRLHLIYCLPGRGKGNRRSTRRTRVFCAPKNVSSRARCIKAFKSAGTLLPTRTHVQSANGTIRIYNSAKNVAYGTLKIFSKRILRTHARTFPYENSR
ncbi:MAG: hypothetical protein J6C93_07695 [Clostridia bacterium]|nr:hypothetical protein [Clostridia bacterium]